jgi:hypothetical protein
MLQKLRVSGLILLACTSCSSGGSGFFGDGGIPDGAEGGTESGTPSGAVPPSRPTTTATGTTRWYAMRRVQLGLTRRGTTTSDANAWAQFGYDLDSRTTTLEDSRISNNSCKRREGSPTGVLKDGALGRDNNFGLHVMSVMKSLKSDIEEAVNSEITEGRRTILIRLDNVGGPDNASVPGSLYLATARTSPPSFDGSDEWPVDNASLDSTTKQPLARFAKGYMAGSVWVSGELGSGTTTLPMPLLMQWAMVPMDGVVISFDTTSGVDSDGTIAGAMGVENMITALAPGAKAAGICPGNATWEQVTSTITQSADLVLGVPSLQDTARTCDAISVGIGFTVTAAVAPMSAVTVPPPTDECTP